MIWVRRQTLGQVDASAIEELTTGAHGNKYRRVAVLGDADGGSLLDSPFCHAFLPWALSITAGNFVSDCAACAVSVTVENVTPWEGEILVPRAAAPSDAQPLTALIRRAKAHWGYPKEWLDAWHRELVISPDYIRQQRVVLLAARGEIAGFFGLELRSPLAHLEHLWVEPAEIRRGIGRKLLTMACADAKDKGYRTIELVADPNAESFYLHHGAIRVGEVHTAVLGTARVLPRMQLDPEQLLLRSRAKSG